MVTDLELLTVGRISVHERTVAFANAAGGIVASRLLCSEAMPYEHEVAEVLEGSPA